MPRRWIDKKSATTYQLVFRAQNDPRIHDDDPSAERVFQAISGPSQAAETSQPAGTTLAALSAEFGSAARSNEGEAAEHGIFYDDSGYDYMQHMRELGAGRGAAVWVEGEQDKGKGKADLAAALQDKLDEPTHLRPATYQDQQAVPDAIAGFQPDMDPRLREVLEALEDDAFVDEDEDGGFFGEIAGGDEISLDEFEAADDDDGWDTDDTARPASPPPAPKEHDPDDQHGDGAFMASFRNLPRSATRPLPAASVSSTAPLGRAATAKSGSEALPPRGRRKKHRGALTADDLASMSSATSLARTEQLTTLDARFEKTLQTYEEEDEYFDDTGSMASGVSGVSGVSGISGISGVSGMSNMSSVPRLVDKKALGGVLDEFLGGYSRTGKKGVRKGRPQTGMEQLDEIRKELGRPVGRAAEKAA